MHVLAAVAQFERSVIRDRINAGLAAAREHGTRSGKPFRRPRTLDGHRDAVKKLMKRGISARQIAAKLKIPVGSIFSVMRSVQGNAGKRVSSQGRVR